MSRSAGAGAGPSPPEDLRTALRAAAARLGRPELAPLVDELARRYGEGSVPASVTLRGLDTGARQALADLLGTDRMPATANRLAVARLLAAVQLADPTDLRRAVELLRGPIADRGAERRSARESRAALWSWVEAEAAVVAAGRGQPEALDGWAAAVRRAGVPAGDVAVHRARLDRVLAVLRRLPADGIGLGGLAADVFGDAHALDRGRAAATLVLDAVAALAGRERAADAEAIRALWEEAGVVPDPLSSTVLALGLRPAGDDPLAGWLRAAADRGEPVVLTLAQLRRWPLAALPADAVGYVVENPSLLAEAAAEGWTGPVLVCSSGRPTFAVVTLLRQLGAAGARLHQHADFDAAGVGISSWLAERAGTLPWRMGAADYRAAVAHSRSTLRLRGPVPATPWDPDLHREMEACDVAVHEEELRGGLLAAMLAR